MGNLEITKKIEKLDNGASLALLYLKGSIDGSTVKKFETEALSLLEQDVIYLILNFSGLGYMNSTGLGILVKVLDSYQEKDGDVKLVSVPKKVEDLFEMLGISSILTIYKDDEEAILTLPGNIVQSAPTPPPPPPPPSPAKKHARSSDLTPVYTTSKKVVPHEEIPVEGLIISDEDDKNQANQWGDGLVISDKEESDSLDYQTGGGDVFEGIQIAPDMENGTPFDLSEKEEVVSKNQEEIAPAKELSEEELEMLSNNGYEFRDEKSESIEENDNEVSFGNPEDEIGDGISFATGLEKQQIDKEEIEEKISEAVEDEIVEDEVVEDEVVEDEAVEDEIVEDEVVEDEVVEDEIVEDEFVEDGVVEDEVVEDEAVEDEAVEEASMPKDNNIIENKDESVDEISTDKDKSPTEDEGIDEIDDDEEIEEEISEDEVGDEGAIIGDEIDSNALFGGGPVGADIDLTTSESEVTEEAQKFNEISVEDKKENLEELNFEDQSSSYVPGEEEIEEKAEEAKNIEETDKEEIEEKAEEAKNIEETDKEEIEEEAGEKAKNIEETDKEEIEEESGEKEEVEEEEVEEISKQKSENEISEEPGEFLNRESVEKLDDMKVSGNMPSSSSSLIPQSHGFLSSSPKTPEIPQPAQVFNKPEEPAPKKKSLYEVKRNTTIRYFEKMNPLKAYHLIVAFSKAKIKKIKQKQIVETEGKAVSVPYEKPEVTITPCLKSCIISPVSITLDISPKTSKANFWITPVAEGKIEGYVEISHEGKVLDKIDIKTCCVKRTWAKISMAIGLMSPAVSYLLDGFELNLKTEILKGFPKLIGLVQKNVGLYLVGFISMAVFIIIAIILFLQSKPKEAELIEKLFQVEPEE